MTVTVALLTGGPDGGRRGHRIGKKSPAVINEAAALALVGYIDADR